MAIRFQNFCAASRKPNIHNFHLLPMEDNLNWIENTIQAPAFYTPTGIVNGVNGTFTLADEGGYILVFVNGVKQVEGIDYNYTSATGTIIFTPSSIPMVGAYLEVVSWGTETATDMYGSIATPIIEIPAGAMNGVNTTFTITDIPTIFTLFYNGMLQKVTTDYSRTTTTITMVVPPVAGDTLIAVYWR